MGSSGDFDPGISDSERQKRKESNGISTKINFFAWTIEVPDQVLKRKLRKKPSSAGGLGAFGFK